MSEVPHEPHDQGQSSPFGTPAASAPEEKPAARPDSELNSPPPTRSPFDDVFGERQPFAPPDETNHAAPIAAADEPALDTAPNEEPVRTSWHPPAMDDAYQPAVAVPEQQPLPLEDPYYPYGPYGYGGIAAEPPMAPPRPRSVSRPAGRLLRELAETVILALVIFLLVRAVVQNFQVEGKSMEPSLQSGWYLLVDKAIYWEINLTTVHKFIPFVHAGQDPTRYLFRGPKRGDVIVFVAPDAVPGTPERDFIKRVIGLPGDTVEVRSCTVFVNGLPLQENYIQEPPAYTYGPTTVPKGQYFVLGDNRNNSSDSHAWGTVPKENIIGQAWIIYWPFHQMGLVNNADIKPGTTANAPTAKAAGTCAAAAQ